MAGALQGYVTEDPERDWPVVARHLRYQVDSYRHHMVDGTDQPLPRPVDPERLRQRDPRSFPLASFTYGTPEHEATTVEALIADAPVETVFMWASLGGAPDEMTARHVEMIGTRLRPLLEAL